MKTMWQILIFLLTLVPAFAQQPPAKVVVAEVFEKEVTKTNQIMGIVDFDKRSGVSSEVSGLIDKQFIVEGTVVKKGDVLVELNTDFIRKSISIMKKQVEQVDIKIQNTQKNLKRYEVLFKKNATSEKVYDDLGDSHKELIKEKEILRKNMEKLGLEIRKSTIKAPFDGMILEKHKSEGEWIDPGTPVCSLASTEDVFVRVSVSEDLVKYIRPGNEILLKISALEKEFTGTVKNFAPVADISSKTFQIKIAIPYFEEAIQNMSALVNVPVSHKTMLRMIKRDALVRFKGKDFVYTVKEDKAAILPVNIVAFEGEYLGVDNAYITPGIPVVIDGNDRLKPDQAVEIVKENG